MRSLLLAVSLLLLPAQASALCRCVCVRGQLKPICQETDLVTPICQGLCVDEVRPERVVTPLAGGRPVFDAPRPFNPAPGRIESMEEDPNMGPNGQPLGTPSTLSGNVGSSLSGGLGSSLSGGR